MNDTKILITGANGQLGSELVVALCDTYGNENVIASDINDKVKHPCEFTFLDITNEAAIEKTIKNHKVTQIYHLAAILSASGEKDPMFTWKINHDGYINILEAARKNDIEKIFFPSSIAVFGNTTPKSMTPQNSPLLPETVYGISKSTGELWSNYYHQRYGLDIRSIRYPGIISYKTLPHGGTTDYAVEIYHEAIEKASYTCFLSAETRLPMMYIEDAIRATLELMEAPKESIKTRIAYNLTAISFTPAEIAKSIKKQMPSFQIKYKPDARQQIADSWTDSIDDSQAASEWGWEAAYTLDKITNTMLGALVSQLSKKSRK